MVSVNSECNQLLIFSYSTKINKKKKLIYFALQEIFLGLWEYGINPFTKRQTIEDFSNADNQNCRNGFQGDSKIRRVSKSWILWGGGMTTGKETNFTFFDFLASCHT